ncbi:SseB family protein [Nonomuraea sp. NPDC049607]|uniref:SseB family protein n=1 Tax=Nonomuraea sp. NPDC049607 TaxID=3154732 RepID=UPI00341E5DB6
MEAAKRFADGRLDSVALHEVFRLSPVFCEAPSAPGFFAREVTGRSIIPIFSSLAALAGFTEHRAWFRTKGDDLLTQLPGRCHLLLDPGTDHALHLRADAIQRVAIQTQRP